MLFFDYFRISCVSPRWLSPWFNNHPSFYPRGPWVLGRLLYSDKWFLIDTCDILFTSSHGLIHQDCFSSTQSLCSLLCSRPHQSLNWYLWDLYLEIPSTRLFEESYLYLLHTNLVWSEYGRTRLLVRRNFKTRLLRRSKVGDYTLNCSPDSYSHNISLEMVLRILDSRSGL